MAISTIEPYWARFMRLKEERGLSWTQLVRSSDKVSLSTLRAFGMDPDGPDSRRWRYPSMETIADVASALGVDPKEFPEYRLALVRQSVDEREVGLERAMMTAEDYGAV